MQPDSEPEVSALPGVPVMIVNDVIWSAGEDVCGYVYLCVQNPAVCVCVCAYSHGWRYLTRLCRGSFHLAGGWRVGGGGQEVWSTMNSSVCSYKHNCLHLLFEWEAIPPQSFTSTSHLLLTEAKEKSRLTLCNCLFFAWIAQKMWSDLHLSIETWR